MIQATDLPIGARAAAMTALRSVCGIEDVEVLLAPSPAGGTVPVATFTGWSPSLHRIACLMTADCATAADDPDFAEDLAAAFASQLGEQRRRLADAMRLGFLAPLPPVTDSADEVRMDHVGVDRALVGILREERLDPYGEIMTSLASIHGPDRAYGGGPVASDDNGVVAETPDGRVVGMALGVGRRVHGREVVYDGLTVDIVGLELPETTLATLAGRRLRDLAEIHPLLDDRRVFGAQNVVEDGTRLVRIATDFDLVPVDSLRECPR